MTQFAHKYMIPLLYTILWAVGIYLCGKEIASDNIVFKDLTYGSFFVSVFYIYVIFILECFVVFFDKALENIKSQFTVGLIFLLCGILLDVGIALWMCFSYIFENKSCAEYFWWIIGLMVFLKLLSSFFSNNIKLFMVKMHIDTKKSDFKLCP